MTNITCPHNNAVLSLEACRARKLKGYDRCVDCIIIEEGDIVSGKQMISEETITEIKRLGKEGLKQKEIKEKLGVSGSTVCRYLKGEVKPQNTGSPAVPVGDTEKKVKKRPVIPERPIKDISIITALDNEINKRRSEIEALEKVKELLGERGL